MMPKRTKWGWAARGESPPPPEPKPAPKSEPEEPERESIPGVARRRRRRGKKKSTQKQLVTDLLGNPMDVSDELLAKQRAANRARAQKGPFKMFPEGMSSPQRRRLIRETDSRLRDLERRAALGDPEAVGLLKHQKNRLSTRHSSLKGTPRNTELNVILMVNQLLQKYLTFKPEMGDDLNDLDQQYQELLPSLHELVEDARLIARKMLRDARVSAVSKMSNNSISYWDWDMSAFKEKVAKWEDLVRLYADEWGVQQLNHNPLATELTFK